MLLRFALLLLLPLLCASRAVAEDWPRFLGPGGKGVAAQQDIPTEWSSSKNIRWRTELPGKGTSSPVVAQGLVFLTCYSGYGLDAEEPGDLAKLERSLIAYDRATGEEAWRTTVASEGGEDPYEGFITQHGYASSTPVVDGNHVYAVLGKSGLYAYTLQGEKVWQVDLGKESDPARWGDASSPVVVGDVVVVDASILGHKIAGYNKLTGKPLWTIEDESYTNSWGTPSEIEIDGTTQVLVHVPGKVMAINITSGDILWTADSPLKESSTSSIVTRDGIAYLMGGREGHAIAVKTDGQGDVSETLTLWRGRLRSGIATPVALNGNLYWPSRGVFHAASCETGELIYRERLPKGDSATGGRSFGGYSSPIAVGDKIIQFTKNGASFIIAPAEEFQLVAQNKPFADDPGPFHATPAVSDGDIFVRSDSYLYCISKTE